MKRGPRTRKLRLLMRAAEMLRQRGQTSFSVEELAVMAGQLDRESFGLAGFERQYPDNRKALTQLYGRRGAINHALIVRVGGSYRITEAGRLYARSHRKAGADT